MDYVLSEHARKRCLRRRIQSDWVECALEAPVRIESDEDDSELLHAIWPVPEMGNRILRVIYNETKTPWIVVTAYFDEKAVVP